MADDYRNTKYCPKIGNIHERKDSLTAKILRDHRCARDMHKFVSANDGPYKRDFVKAYHGKCAYCGVSKDILPLRMFEVDHFICKASVRFYDSKNPKEAAGYMENLVLACQDCNRSKRDLEISSDMEKDLHPDYEGITRVFFRDAQYYIRVSKEKEGNLTIEKFYNQLHLGNELRRVDYLLMSMKGMYEVMRKKRIKPDVSNMLLEAIILLQSKRNIMMLHTDVT